MATTEEELTLLDRKVMQLRLDYERFFLGTRPREPVQLRAEVQKTITQLSNQAIQNTALRFKFGSICSRFQAFKRQWGETLRKMDEGSYSRHRFRAGLRARGAPAEAPPPSTAPATGGSPDRLFDAYLDARRRCGQSVARLTPDRLESILQQQRTALRRRYGDADFRFEVVVEDGKAKLRASRSEP